MVQKGESQEIGEKGSGTNPERHEVEDERSWTPQKPGKFSKRKLRSLKKGAEEETEAKSTTGENPARASQPRKADAAAAGNGATLGQPVCPDRAPPGSPGKRNPV